ncbi:C40 family peptidase [Cohnella laeviribosi]|jgi:cell wall-associated NlpC family hydrolase|uniref:C40 family peptidase n=1 Tax=Cohnella laeviribosi TaxID=380174 RepID=UPI000369FDDE|nr:C40 family peptidase [Cohnella laeviribosi]
MMKRKFAKLASIGLLTALGYFGFTAVSSTQASAATAESLRLVALGKEYIGTPYLYGAPSFIEYAFDCSSYVQFVYSKLGISLPRTSGSQAAVGEKVNKAYLSMGDLVFFKSDSNAIGHVGIYAGNGKFLHASSSKGVTLSDLNSSYWKVRYVTARRVL